MIVMERVPVLHPASVFSPALVTPERQGQATGQPSQEISPEIPYVAPRAPQAEIQILKSPHCGYGQQKRASMTVSGEFVYKDASDQSTDEDFQNCMQL